MTTEDFTRQAARLVAENDAQVPAQRTGEDGEPQVITCPSCGLPVR